MAVDLTRKVAALETFASVGQEKITRLEQCLAEVERTLGDVETELKKAKHKA